MCYFCDGVSDHFGLLATPRMVPLDQLFKVENFEVADLFGVKSFSFSLVLGSELGLSFMLRFKVSAVLCFKLQIQVID